MKVSQKEVITAHGFNIVKASPDTGEKVLRKLSEKVTFTVGSKMFGHGAHGHYLDVGQRGLRP